MSGDAGWRSTIPWWYVGGAVVTLVVTVLLSDTVTLPPATAVIWGPLIGLEIYERRAAASRGAAAESPARRRTASPRREPIAAALMTSGALGIGLIVGFRQSEPPNWTAAAVGLVMVGIPLVVVAVSMVRRRAAP